VTIEEPGVDGIWVPQLGEEVYRLCDTLVDDVVCVSDDEIREAIRDGFEDTRALLEPAGALTCSLWLRLLTIGCAYLLWLCLLLIAVLTRRLLGGGTYGYRLPCIRLQAAMHTVTGCHAYGYRRDFDRGPQEVGGAAAGAGRRRGGICPVRGGGF